MSDSITRNKVVDITYLIKDQSGITIEQNDVPVSYLHGVQGDLLPALEQALDGKQLGDSIEVELAPADAFGERDPSLTFTDNIDDTPKEYHHIGAEAQFQNKNGEARTFVVSKIEGNQITLDGNHPFAGKTVTFAVNVKAIREASAQELADGRPVQEYALDSMNPPPISDRH